MRFSTYREQVGADLFRYAGRTGVGPFLRHFLLGQGFNYLVWMRTVRFLKGARVAKLLFYVPAVLMRRRSMIRFGIDIPPATEIGPGFYIGHFGGIVVSYAARIGSNVNISQGVTIGRIAHGERAGAPVIGNHVYIGPGAKIVGPVTIGDHVAIGANAVVTKDVPDHAVVAGVPAKILSNNGSADYIQNADWAARRRLADPARTKTK